MSGTKAGGIAAARTNKERHGADFYKRIGTKGGKLGTTGGFAYPNTCNCELLPYMHMLRSCAGQKGGKVSRRRKSEKI